MTDSERIKEIKKELNLSYNQIAKEIGLTTVQTLYDIKNEKHGISKDLANKIHAKYSNIDLVWLLTGKGQMLKSSEQSDVNIQETESFSTPKDTGALIERIKTIIAYYGLSNRAFALHCGLKDNTFTNQLNGVRELSLATIDAILISNEDISAEWLLRGKGSMLLSPSQSIDQITTTDKESLIGVISTLQKVIQEKDKMIQSIREKSNHIG